jgi:hypothetical protein
MSKTFAARAAEGFGEIGCVRIVVTGGLEDANFAASAEIARNRFKNIELRHEETVYGSSNGWGFWFLVLVSCETKTRN